MKKNKEGVFAALRAAVLTHRILSVGTILCVAASVAASLLPPLLLACVIDRLTGGLSLTFAAVLLYFGSLALEGLLGTEAPEEGLVERIALREAVDQLPEKERMTILLRYFKGLTQERAARVLGVSQVQVSRLERRGLERLRQSFAE